MLDIPSVVTARLKSDTVKKNFRVQFPNGEYNDITNENIVYESVRFSESICSQDTFRFGLAESSRIEFETVGIGNMLGMQIACFCEVDLTGENVNNLVNWAGDGETVPLADSDLGYAFFRIPYGVFTVESCPRNHEAMTHRKVTAISTMFHNNSYMCPFEQTKTSAYWLGQYKQYNMKIKEFMAENFAYYGGNALDEFGFTSTTNNFTFYSSPETNFTSPIFEFYDANNTLVQTWAFSCHVRARSLSEDGSIGAYDGLMGIDLAGYDTTTPYQTFKSLLNSNIDYSKTLIVRPSPQNPLSIELANDEDAIGILFNPYVIPYITMGTGTGATGADVWLRNARNRCYLYTDDNTARCFYPALPGDAHQTDGQFQAVFPYDVTVTIVTYNGQSSSTTTRSFNSASSVSGLKGYIYNDNSPNKFLGRVRLSFSATLGDSLDTTGQQTLRSFINSFSFANLCQDFCEINGLFLNRSRDGGVRLTRPGRRGNEIDLTVIPEQYSEFWWDEYEVEPIGEVKYTYTVEGEYGDETQEDVMIVGAGSSVYDLSGNCVLDNLYNTNIPVVIKNAFYINGGLANIHILPFELTSQGFPQLEAGDVIKITAADNTEVISYALECEITGIQYLREYIKASVGDPISIEGELNE